MNKLDKEQRIALVSLIKRLREAEAQVEATIDRFNVTLLEEAQKIQHVIDDYNILVSEASELVTTIHDEQDDFF